MRATQHTPEQYCQKGLQCLQKFADEHWQEDLTQGLAFLQKAVEAGNNDARCALGETLLRYEPNRIAEGIEYLQTAFDDGSNIAGHRLFQLYFNGQGIVEPDIEKAIEYLEEMYDDDANAKKLLYQICLSQGWGKYDPKKGMRILEELADTDFRFNTKLVNYYLNKDMQDVYNPQKAVRRLKEMVEEEKKTIER